MYIYFSRIQSLDMLELSRILVSNIIYIEPHLTPAAWHSQFSFSFRLLAGQGSQVLGAVPGGSRLVFGHRVAALQPEMRSFLRILVIYG